MRETQFDAIIESRLDIIEKISEVNKPGYITEIAREINNQFKKLRESILINKNRWNHNEYCHRFALHYYTLALYFYTKYKEHKTNLDIIRINTEKCLSKLSGIRSTEREIKKTEDLFVKATDFKRAIDNIYIKLENKLHETDVRNTQAKILISLGNVDYENFDISTPEFTTFHTHLIGVLLINIITDIEESLALNVDKDNYSKSNLCRYLARAYQISGQQILFNEYMQRATVQIKQAFQKLGAIDGSPELRKKIKDIIKLQVHEHERNLQEIYTAIKEEYSPELTNLDIVYIERKFIKYCIQDFQESVNHILKRIADSNNEKTFIRLLTNLEQVRNLDKLPDYFTTDGYYKLLIDHKSILRVEQHNKIIKDYKRMVWESISPKIIAAQKELDVLTQLIIFLRSLTDVRSILFDLQVGQFCNKQISVQTFTNNILNLHLPSNEHLANLKALTTEISDKNNLFFMDKFVDVLQSYAFPPEPKIQGEVMKIEGKLVILSEVMDAMVRKKTDDIKELRIGVADVLYINRSLKNEHWAGVNVIVAAKTIHVQGKQVWDISGNNGANHTTKAPDGVEKGEDGRTGKSGHSGLSGGNVYLSCCNIINSANLTIKTNGGKGGRGQDGGDGAMGEDGTGIEYSTFQNLISPPEPEYTFLKDLVAAWWKVLETTTVINLNTTLDLLRVVEQIEERGKQFPKIPLPKISKIMKTFDVNWTQGSFRINFWNTASCYFEGITDESCQVTYSYYPHWSPCKQEVLILHKGTLATLGGQGGTGGTGGPGGFPGKVTIKCPHPVEISIDKQPGEIGNKGNSGTTGRPGKNGWDMGFAFVNGWSSAARKTFGQNQNLKLDLKYHNCRKYDNNVDIPYLRDYLGKSDHYAEVQERKSDTNVINRNTNRRKNEEENEQEKATRNKAISTQVISEFEQNIASDVVDELMELTLQMENLKEQALEEIVEKDEEKETEMTNFQMQRQAVFDDSSLQIAQKKLRKRQKNITRDTVNKTVDDLLENPTNVDLWESLKNVTVNLPDLQRLFSLLLQNKTNLNNKFTKLYNLLLAKYKITILQEVEGKNMPNIDVSFTPEPIENYLVLDSDVHEFINDYLGTLQDYFQPNSEELMSCVQDYLHTVDIGDILYPLKFFIMEKSFNDTTFKGYSQNVLQQLNNLEKRLERLIKCYMVAYQKNEDSFILKDIEIKKKKIIENFKNETDFSYVLDEFETYIGTIGMSSSAVRELLACAFDTNIKIYLVNQNRQFILYHNHNPTAQKTLYFFLANGQFVQFHIDDKYVNLITERKKLAKNYSDILSFTDEFVCQKDFDEFLKNFEDFNGYEGKQKLDKLPEDNIIKKICANFSNLCEMYPIVSKLKSGYIKNNKILSILLQRFNIEGCHIEEYELIYIVNTIIRSYLNKDTNLELFEWILSVKPQTVWVNEFFYIQLENYFKKSLKSTSIPKNIKKVHQKNMILLMDIKLRESTENITLKCVNTCLEVLGEIEPDEETIRTLPISKWQYTLREQLLEYRLVCLTNWESNEQLQKALYFLNCLESNVGTTLIDRLLGVLDTQKSEINSIICLDLLSLLHLREWSLDEDLLNKLSNYGIGPIREELLQARRFDDERDLKTLLKLINGNSHTSYGIKQVLAGFDQHPILSIPKIEKPYSASQIKNWATEFVKNIKLQNKKDIKKYIDTHTNEILIHILHAIQLKKGFFLRKTQRLAILLMLAHNHNILSQISTGEGKSLIVVVVSIFKALCGEKVDIITSSSVLAMRDAEIHKDIYDLFNIGVGHNCSDKISERTDAYSACQVIFGDLSNFQRDYLLDRFYGQNILGNRTFDTLIVDEVDSMLLDKGNNTLYLSHEIPGLDKLESVYQFLWKRICMSVGRKHKNLEHNLKIQVLFDLYGTLTINDIQTHLDVTTDIATNLYNLLKDIKVIDSKNIVQNQISEQNQSTEVTPYIHKLRYLINKILNRPKEIRIPKCLYKFVERHVETWIKNGLLAIQMEEGIDYVVDVDRTQTKADVNPNITIIDKGTGTDQSNSQWEEALHQFLQLKHGCKVSAQTLKAVFISNVSYFKEYTKLFGLTGTLGSQVERDLLHDLYSVEFVNIPTAKPKKFLEQEAILCCTETDWQFTIVNRSKELTIAGRSVLIICETIKEVNILAKAFQNADIPNKRIYKREYEECLLAQGKENLDSGSIIIATNLAGRGTDIKITDNLNNNGGLHVLLTYLPSNTRIWQQAFGRAARCGCNGSGQLIIIGHGSFLDKREQLETIERQRIADIKKFFDTRISVEERYFKDFTKTYKKCNTSIWVKLKFNDKKLKEIASQRLLDRWAFWIDEYGSKLSEKTTDKKFEEFNKSLKDDFTKWDNWDQDPIQLVKVGRNYIDRKKCDKAVKAFNAVIKLEPQFCEAAHYYKALALVMQLNFENRPFSGQSIDIFKEFVQELRHAERLFEDHKDACITSSAFVQNLKQNMKNSFMTIDAYKSQQETLMTLYDFYINSINDILGHPVTKSSFISQEINQDWSTEIYDAFLEKSILKKSKIVVPKKGDIEEIAASFGISSDVLLCFVQSYKNKNIEEQDFLEDLKQTIKIPNLEQCWDTFVKENKLINEKRLVILEKSKLTTRQEDALNLLPQAAVDLKSCKGKYVLMKQYIKGELEEPFVIEEQVLTTNNYGLYETLKKENLIKFNRIAEFCYNNTSQPISHYDYLTQQHIMSDKILPQEADAILDSLTSSNFLEKSTNNTYTLATKYDENNIPKIPMYDQSLFQILRINFAYRIVLQNLEEELNNPQEQVSLKIISEPHTSLMWEMIGKKIIESVGVQHHQHDEIKKVLAPYGNNADERKSISRFVEDVLKRLAGSLKSLEVPSFKQESIREHTDSIRVSNLQELRSFEINSLEYIIKAEEKKYTKKMILNTLLVTLLGIIEIAAGLAIQLFFAGTLSHLGNFLLSEGVSDFLYAVSCFWSGHFSWSDYGQYKLQSLITNLTLTFSSAAFASGVKYSKFGDRLAMSGVIGQSGKAVAELTGRELIKEVGAKAVAKEFGKQFIYKVGEGIGKGMVNEGISHVVDSYLQNLCNQLSNTLVGDIETAVNSHELNQTLVETYQLFGKKESKDKIVFYTEKGLAQPALPNMVLEKAADIMNLICNVCTEASKVGKKIPYAEYVPYLAMALSMNPYRQHIDEITSSITRVLNQVNNQMKQDIAVARAQGVKQKTCTDRDTQTFKNDVMNQWRTIIQERANKIFSDRIAKPVLRDCSFMLLRKGTEGIKKLYNFSRNTYHRHIFDTAKQKKETQLKDKTISEETRNTVIQQYDETIVQLQKNVRDPQLYSELVQEKGYMDAVCLKAGSCVLDKIKVDSRPVRLKCTTDCGATVELCSLGEGEPQEVKINLKDKHFDNETSSSPNDYDFLYHSLAEKFPELRNISPDQFRQEISKEITTNKEISKDIRQGKHAFTIRRQMYGGYSKEKIATTNLRKGLEDGKYLFSQSSVSVRTQDIGQEKGVHMTELIDSICDKFDENKLINVVELPCGKQVFLDNRRVVAASTIDNPDVSIYVRVFKYNEPLSPDLQQQYSVWNKKSKSYDIQVDTAGYAAEVRIQRTESFGKKFRCKPYSPREVRIRQHKEFWNKPEDKIIEDFYRRAKDVGYIKHTRSNSVDRGNSGRGREG